MNEIVKRHPRVDVADASLQATLLASPFSLCSISSAAFGLAAVTTVHWNTSGKKPSGFDKS